MVQRSIHRDLPALCKVYLKYMVLLIAIVGLRGHKIGEMWPPKASTSNNTARFDGWLFRSHDGVG